MMVYMMLFAVAMGCLVLLAVFLAAAFLLMVFLMVGTIGSLLAAFHTAAAMAAPNCNAGTNLVAAVVASPMPMGHHRHGGRTARHHNR